MRTFPASFFWLVTPLTFGIPGGPGGGLGRAPVAVLTAEVPGPGGGDLGKAPVALFTVDPTAGRPAGFGFEAADTLTLPPAPVADANGSTYGVAGVFGRALGVDATFAALAGGAGRPFTFEDADGSAVLVYPFACLGADAGAGFLSRALMGCFLIGPF